MKFKKGSIWIHKYHKWKTKITKVTKTHIQFTYGNGVVWGMKHSFKSAFKPEGE